MVKTALPTVLRLGSLRFVIWPNDHAPPHVHVISGDTEASIELGEAPGLPRLAVNQGMKRAELAVALQAVLEHRDDPSRRWNEIHG